MNLKTCLLLVLASFTFACDSKTDTASKDASNQLISNASNTSAILLEDTIPAYEQRPGDLLKGSRVLSEESIVSCGIPMSAMNELAASSQDGSQPFYGYPGRSGEAASLPFNLNLVEDKNGVKLAASNCLSCHGAPLFGELVVGLGNEFLDYTQNVSTIVEQSGALVSGKDEVAAWEKFADRIAAVAPYIQMQTAGVNPANNLSFALMAHRDPKTMQWSDEPLISTPSKHVAPVSVPPWWRMKKKNAMFWMGEGRGDHATFMMMASLLCVDSIEEVQRLDSIAPDLRAFIESLEPPSYPMNVDAQLAEQGRSVFESTCSVCHGTYGDNPSYPNRLVSIDVVKTDSGLIDYAFGEGQAYINWFKSSPYSESSSAQPSRGYVAPPLDGIWATGPFLHNGSVPTIRAVLDSQSRPELWHHTSPGNTEKDNFNSEDLGWRFTAVRPSDQADSQAISSELSVDPQWLYDTRVKGYSNQGHEFGDALSSAHRDAVLEYLKTL